MHIPTKRWRGYYRALKRGETWAIKFSKLNKFSQLMHWTYRTEMFESILHSNNWILNYIHGFSSSFYHQPVILGLEHGVTFVNTEKKEDEQK